MTLSIVGVSLDHLQLPFLHHNRLLATDCTPLGCINKMSLFGRLWPLTASRECMAFGVQLL